MIGRSNAYQDAAAVAIETVMVTVANSVKCPLNAAYPRDLWMRSNNGRCQRNTE
jgi:hypothetical protein